MWGVGNPIPGFEYYDLFGDDIVSKFVIKYLKDRYNLYSKWMKGEKYSKLFYYSKDGDVYILEKEIYTHEKTLCFYINF
jgi:hypothetical protein